MKYGKNDITRLLSSSDVAERRKCLNFIASDYSLETIEVLNGNLNSPYPDVRSNSVLQLAFRGENTCVDKILYMLVHDEHIHVRRICAASLNFFCPHTVPDNVQIAFLDGDDKILIALLSYLIHVPDTRYKGTVANLLLHEKESIRLWACLAHISICGVSKEVKRQLTEIDANQRKNGQSSEALDEVIVNDRGEIKKYKNVKGLLDNYM